MATEYHYVVLPKHYKEDTEELARALRLSGSEEVR